MKQGLKFGVGFILAHAIVGLVGAVMTVVLESALGKVLADEAETVANRRDTDPLGRGTGDTDSVS